MKTVLGVAYYFPPGGGAGVQRTVKFVRYLPELGWRPVIVAPPVQVQTDWSPEDSTFVDEIAGKADVLRVETPPPPQPTRWRARVERWLKLRSEHERWWSSQAAERGLEHGDFDVVYATMSPWDSGEAAADLSRRSGTPWVADLRDPWALDEMQFYPSGVHRRLEARRMRQLLERADAVIMNTPEAGARLLQTFPSLRSKRVEVITNGYDAADFAGPAPSVDESKFRIVHTGHLHTELGGQHHFRARVRRLIGGRVNVDFLTRSHIYLLQAVARVLALRPDLRDRLEVHLAGALSEADRDAIGLGCVKTYGYVSHAESVEILRSADLLFLPMQNLPAGTRATITPGKTYEYLASGRPILAALPDGDARDLVGSFERSTVVRPDDVDGMVQAILARVDQPRPPDAPPTGLESYERREQTRRLAELLDAVAR